MSSRAGKSPAMIVIGALLIAFGLLFMFQGVGAVKGSSMTNSNFWAAAGPVIAIVGLVLLRRGARRGRPSDIA